MENVVDISTITTAMVSALTSMQQAVLTSIGSIVPVIMPIFGAILAIGIIIKTTRRIAK